MRATRTCNLPWCCGVVQLLKPPELRRNSLLPRQNSVVYLKAKRTFNLADTGENQMDPHQSSGSFSQADQLRHHMEVSKSSLSTQESECRKIAQKAMDGFGTIPRTKSFELYLVRGIAIPSGGSEKDARVIFPPEFIFVLDVNMESLIGVSIFWSPVGYGDPGFPDFSKIALRSITSRDSRHIIFPNIAGSIMIGTREFRL